MVGFLGPNGAGKTTTIRTLLGLSRPTSGSCRVLGETVPGPTLTRVGSLVDGPALYPWMTASGNLKALAPVAGSDEVDALVERVGLAHATTQKASTYSHGMRQRLALAIALSGEPAALVLDEPANGLDPVGNREIRRLLRQVADSGCAVFLSSHQLGDVELSCDRVLVLSRGRVVAEGPPKDLGAGEPWMEVRLSTDDHQATQQAQRALSTFACRVREPGVVLVQAESGAEVSRVLSGAGIYPESVAPVASSLEERFLDLIGDQQG